MAYDRLEFDLRELETRGRLRSLRQRSGVDFTSNDYLALAESEELSRAAADAIARGRIGRITAIARQPSRARGARD